MSRCIRIITGILLLISSTQLQAQDSTWVSMAQNGDVDALRSWVAAGGDVNAQDENGATVLMWTAMSGNLDAVKFVIEQGAAFNQKGTIWVSKTGKYGNLIVIASGEGHIEILKYLVEIYGIPVDDRELDSKTSEDTGWRALQWAVWKGKLEITEFLLEKGASVDKGGDTYSPLILAAARGRETISRMLVCRGAKLGTGENSAANMARTKGYVHLATYLESGLCEEEVLEGLKEAEKHQNAYFQHYRAGKYKEAAHFGEQALQLRETLLDDSHPEFAASLNNLAFIYKYQGRFDEAEPLYLKAIKIRQDVLGTNSPVYATYLNNLAELYRAQGRYREAEPLYIEAIEIRGKLLGTDHALYASSMNNLAILYNIQGRLREAEPLHVKALEVRRKALGTNNPLFANSINNLAIFYRYQGRYSEAEPLFIQAIEIRRKTQGINHPDYATSLNNLASLYRSQRRYSEAEPLYIQAMEISKETLGQNHPEYARSLSNLASLYKRQGRYNEAESLQLQALDIRRKSYGENHPEYASNLSNLATLYASQDLHNKADSLYRISLEILGATLGNDHPRYANLLNNLHRYDEAIKVMERPENRGKNPELTIDIYSKRSLRRYSHSDSIYAAIEDLRKAIDIFEAQRPQVGGGEAIRADYLDNFSTLFTRIVRWLAAEGELEEAFGYLEQSRSRILLDQLNAAKIDLRAKIDPAQLKPLEEQEREALKDVAELNHQITLARADTIMTNEARITKVDSLARSLYEARQILARIDHEIKNLAPDYRDNFVTGGKPVNIRSLRRTIIPESGLLLSYMVSDEGSMVFGIGQNSFWVDTLRVPTQMAAELNIEASDLTRSMLHQLLFGNNLDHNPGVLSGFRRDPRSVGKVTQKSHTAMDQMLKTELRRNLFELWQALIPEDRRKEIMTAEAVIVIPDGPLHALPFEALVVDSTQQSYWTDKGPLLWYGSSATVLYNMEQRPKTSPLALFDDVAVLSLSDPEYNPFNLSTTDSTRNSHVQADTTNKTRDQYEERGGILARLKHTAEETEAIKEAYEDQVNHRVEALQRSDAQESALRQHLPGKRYIHLATHGLTDHDAQGLFAALALTPPGQSESVTPENDGFLELHEIYDLSDEMQSVELAVLSACETNIGNQYRGEGVFALSRGFMTSGARRVIASQWAVYDKSTAALMAVMFKEIAMKERNAEVIDYAAALRKAQLAVRHNDTYPQWQDPLYWAPFILIGGR